MKRKLQFLIFFTIANLILISFCLVSTVFYVLAFDLSLTTGVILTAILYLLAFSYIPGDSLGQKLDAYGLKWIGGVAMGAVSIGVPISLFGFILFQTSLNPKDLGVVSLSIWAIAVIGAIYFNRRHPKVTQLGLTLGSEGREMKIVQLSDIHLNGLESDEDMHEIVGTVNKLNADVLVFTGDLMDIDPKLLNDKLLILKKMKVKKAKLAVSGNHDFYLPAGFFEDALNALEFKNIDNDFAVIDSITFLGIPDSVGSRYGIFPKKMEEIVEEKEGITILLKHRPDHFEFYANKGVDLQLSGHTHWGQVPPWGFLVKLRYKYGKGIGKFNKSYIYTSRGTGTWGPPMRLTGSPEIVSILLKY